MALRDTPEGREQLAALLAAPPPRQVLPGVRKAALRQGYPQAIAMVGAAFTLIGLALVSSLFPWHFYQDWALQSADTATAPGRIISVQRTSMTIGGSKTHRGTPVYDYAFEFSIPALNTVRGECYTTGEVWKSGQAVTVRYRPERPTLACVEGGRLSEGDESGFFTLVFPCLGGGIFFWCWQARRRTLHLLQCGQAAEATVTAIEKTLTKINNQPVYKMTLQCDATLSGKPLTARHHRPEVIAFARERLASQQPVYVLFDPAKPKSCLLPEAF